MMSAVHHSIRLPLTLDTALRRLARNRHISTYALLQQCVRVGLASLSGEQAATTANTGIATEIAKEMGSLSARLAHVERLAERGLYVGCAAYSFARAAAGPRADDGKLTNEINAAFARQLTLAGDM